MRQEEILHDPLLKMDILLWRVMKLLTRNKRHILDRFGLTCSQFEILSAIYYFSTLQEEIIQVNLAEKTYIDPMTTSTILRNLEKKGLIKRQRGRINTRTVIVELSPSGYDVIEEVSEQIRICNYQIYKDIDKNDLVVQLMRLTDKLNKLNN